jgi:excinuclease ABC subunit C
MKDTNGNIIYIGKAKNLKNRVSSYFREHANHNEKTIKMVSKVADYDFIVTDSEYECLLLECSLIKQHRPKYNILLKDSKGYTYINVTKGEYPRITTSHQKDPHGEYIGVYTSSTIARDTVDEVSRVFRLPTCNKVFPRDLKKGRPCLNYHIDRCMGVCTGNIPKSFYQETVAQAVEYIKHGSEDSIERLTQEMLLASKRLDFEKAILLRNRIDSIKKSSQTQKVRDLNTHNVDYIGKAIGTDCTSISILKYRGGKLFDKENYFLNVGITGENVLETFTMQYYTNLETSQKPETIYIAEPLENIDNISKAVGVKVVYRQRGEVVQFLAMAKNNASEYLSIREDKTSREVKALETLAKSLGLKAIPNRIEAYDISNIGSQVMVGSMVVFENGRPNKKLYRKFNIDDITIQNDYACMENILTRRLKYLVDTSKTDESFSKMPDLILVDGGSTHVGVVRKVVSNFGLSIPVFGIVKDSNHHTRAIASNGGVVSISKFDDAFKLLTSIQDEMHRFAITYARGKHRKDSLSTQLTNVKGIGEKRVSKLMAHFKTTSNLKSATVEELQVVAGVTKSVAENLYHCIQDVL